MAGQTEELQGSTQEPPTPEQVAERFGLMRVHRRTGAFYRRLGPVPPQPDLAAEYGRPRDYDWEWVGFTPAGFPTGARRADEHAWGPAWVEFRLTPTGTDVTVGTRPERYRCGHGCYVGGPYATDCPTHTKD